MKEQQFERGPRVACGCVLAVGREAALWACDTAVCYGLHWWELRGPFSSILSVFVPFVFCS